MDELIKALSELSPLSSILEKKLGLSKQVSAGLSTIIFICFCYIIVFIFKRLSNRYKTSAKAFEDVKPQFDYLSIKKARKLYIDTQFQNSSPTRQEEPGFTHRYIARNKLIPFFIKTAFNEKTESDKFYLVLADSGMGKTTFMVNLYFAYHSFLNTKKKYDLKLFRFSNLDTIPEIKSIPSDKSKNTILLLDALDEDPGIISQNPKISDTEAFKKRVDEIIELTRNFKEVIITCRTQYFPGQEDDPYELKIKRPDERGNFTLSKIYISPFNDKEVKKYLNKKFGYIPFFNRSKRKRAKQVVYRSKHLVMRPMLLSYIDYLIEDDVNFVTTYQLYKELVKKWLIREAEKRKMFSEREFFISNLYNFSEKTATQIYLNWKKNGYMYITKQEAFTTAESHSIQLKPEEITGQSLLTCDGSGNWKFAHKSILEFFLAKYAFDNPQFLRHLNFSGMDMAKKFYEELKPRFALIDINANEQKQAKNRLRSYNNIYIYNYPVTIFEYEKIAGNGLRSGFDSNESKIGSLKDATYYCNQLNKHYGYKDVYDDDYNFLNEKGSVTNDLNEVFGFRLPTAVEFEQYVYKIANFREFVRLEKLSETKQTGTIQKFIKLTLEENKFINLSLETPEWCLDFSGPSLITSKRTNSANKKMQDFLLEKKKDAGSITYKPISNIGIEINRNLKTKELSQFQVAFRFILNP